MRSTREISLFALLCLFGVSTLFGTAGSANAQTPAPSPAATPVPEDFGFAFEPAPGVDLKKVDYWQNYQPTIVNDTELMSVIGSKLRKPKGLHSQCFNRAEVWSYEMSERARIRFGKELNLVKVFIFYSDAFRERNHFDWWFHVAPAFFTGAPKNGKLLNVNELVVTDRIAFDAPQPFGYWTDYFSRMQGEMKSGGCKLINTFHEYAVGRSLPNEDCFEMVVPMYYYSPTDFAAVEKYGHGYPDFKWDEEALSEAYQQAFNMNIPDIK